MNIILFLLSASLVSCYEINWSRGLDTQISTLIDHHHMNKRVFKALSASTDSLSHDLERFVFQLGYELPIDSPSARHFRKCLVMEAKSNGCMFVVAIALQKSVQARCRWMLRWREMEELVRDLVSKILERSLVLDEALVSGYETFRSRVGYLRQVKLGSTGSEGSTDLWPLHEMLLIFKSVQNDYHWIKAGLEETSTIRRRLKFKYSKCISAGTFQSLEEKEKFRMELVVLDCQLRFLGKLVDSVVARVGILLSRRYDTNVHDESKLRRKVIASQTAVLQLRTELIDIKTSVNKSFVSMGVVELIVSAHKIEKLSIMHAVQIRQTAYLRLVIKETIRLYKQANASKPLCPVDQSRILNGWCLIVRYMLASLWDSALWLQRKIKANGKLVGSRERKALGTMLEEQKDILRTLRRWRNTVERLSRLSADILVE